MNRLWFEMAIAAVSGGAVITTLLSESDTGRDQVGADSPVAALIATVEVSLLAIRGNLSF